MQIRSTLLENDGKELYPFTAGNMEHMWEQSAANCFILIYFEECFAEEKIKIYGFHL